MIKAVEYNANMELVITCYPRTSQVSTTIDFIRAICATLDYRTEYVEVIECNMGEEKVLYFYEVERTEVRYDYRESFPTTNHIEAVVHSHYFKNMSNLNILKKV